MGNLREEVGVATFPQFQTALSTAAVFTPFSMAGSFKVFSILMQKPDAGNSPVKITTTAGEVLMRFIVPQFSLVMMDVPFIADKGLEISVDTDNSGTLTTGLTTTAVVFRSHRGA